MFFFSTVFIKIVALAEAFLLLCYYYSPYYRPLFKFAGGSWKRNYGDNARAFLNSHSIYRGTGFVGQSRKPGEEMLKDY